MKLQVPLSELQMRLKRFRAKMDETNPEWEMVVIFSKINLFYFTGTMQDGMLIIPHEGEAVLWVRRSIERARYESLFSMIKPMGSFRDAAASIEKLPQKIYMEMEIVPLALYQRFRMHFPFTSVERADSQIEAVRAVKSQYELSIMEKSGEVHR